MVYKLVDETTKVQEEELLVIYWYSINAVLEPIGIAFLEDIFSGMERAWKRFTA